MAIDGRHLFHTRNEVEVDHESHLAHSRAEVHVDETGYRGTTRGIIHRQAPLRRRGAAEEQSER